MLKQIKFSTRIYVGIIMIVLISNVLMCAINYWQMSNGMKQLVRLYASSIPEDLFLVSIILFCHQQYSALLFH